MPASPAAGEPLGTGWVARVDPAVRWAALLVSGSPGDGFETRERWPADLRLPRGILALATRARESGRVTRAALPDGHGEWLAVPHGSRDAMTVLGAHGLDDGRRSRLTAAVGRGERPALAAVPRPLAPPDRRADVAASTAGTKVAAGGDPIERVVLGAVAAHGDLEAVALATADAAASVTGCCRVTIGVERGGAARLLAVSGEARPDRRRGTVRRLQRMLDDVLASGRVSASADDLPTLALRRHGPRGARVVAVLERAAGRPFTDDERSAFEGELAPALALVGRLERGDAGRSDRLLERLRSAWRNLRQGRGRGRAGLVAALIVTLVGLLAVPLPYRVSARVVVEASERQVLTAPYAGHVRSARARAGNTVVAGEVLATLDDRELSLARERWRGEAAKNRAEQSRALAGHDRVELARLRADAARLDAELALVEERRARGTVRAPFDGIVIAGDPTRSLGAPVEAGDVLFEVAASERRSPLVEIDERDIAGIAPGARVRVRMAASPRVVREARLDALVPVAVAETGRSVFRVPATFVDGADAALSPGMQGVARIDAGRRSLANAWTRTLREKLLLLGWSFGLVR